MLQTAYQIQVASSEKLLTEDTPDIWDSGKTASSQSVLVPYNGPVLKSRQRCYWRVRVWDQNGQPSEFSSIDWWEMGLLNKSDWAATLDRQRKGIEEWEPRFTYHGFRYVQVSGLSETAYSETVRARVVHTAFERIGEFTCSNELLNRLYKCTEWSYRGNYVGIPTDCPHREKNGWTGDVHIAAETGLFMFAGSSAYRHWLRSLADSQRSEGKVACIIPSGGWGYDWGSGPAWDSALFLIPWYILLIQRSYRALF